MPKFQFLKSSILTRLFCKLNVISIRTNTIKKGFENIDLNCSAMKEVKRLHLHKAIHHLASVHSYLIDDVFLNMGKRGK